MSTVAQLIDRINREYLYPPREQPSRTTLAAGISAGAASLTYTSGVLAVEEEAALGEGVIIQVDRELMLVTDVNTSTHTITMETGWLGTDEADHAIGAELVISPDYPRQIVFDAVADALEGLWPDLYIVKTTETTVSSGWEVAPENVGDVVGCNYYHASLGWRACGVKVLKGFPDSGTNRAFQFAGGAPGARAYVVYKAKPTRIVDESTDLADVYDDYTIEKQWEAIVILEAVGAIMSSVDVDAHTQEFITQSVQNQGFEVGKGESVRDALLRLASFKRTQARKALMREHPLTVVQSGYAYGDAG